MILHTETITPKMREVAGGIFSGLDHEYYLAGGTALSLRIGNRKSIDLDYFIAKQFDTLSLKSQIIQIFPQETVEIIFEQKSTLWCVISGVKVSFIFRQNLLLDPIESIDCFRIASIRDITVMKLSAVCGREEYKDYFDLVCISKITDVRSWIQWWSEVNIKEEITSWVVALGAIDLIPKVPLDIALDFRNIDVPKEIKKIVDEITRQVELLGK